jgi:hypothetical protein
MRLRAMLSVAGALLPGAACGLAVNGLGPAGAGDAGLDDAPWRSDGSQAGDDATTGADGDDDGAGDDAVAPEGSALDGGISDSALDAGVDGPPPGGPSLCATASVLFCDGFENGLGQWTSDTVGGKVQTDKTHVFRGNQSLHAQVDAIKQPASTVYAREQHFQTWPLDVFVRVFLYQPSPLPPASYDFVELVAGAAPYPGMDLRMQPPAQLGATAFGGPDDSWSSTAALPVDEWACLEMEVDAPNGTFRAWLNDAPVPDLTRTFTTPIAGYGILKVGLAYFQAAPQGATDVWIDEVAVDGARIGCTK